MLTFSAHGYFFLQTLRNYFCSLSYVFTQHCHMYNQCQMDTKSVRCLINSISRFIHLVSCQILKPIPSQKDYRIIVSSLKLLKPVLDEVADYRISSEEILFKEYEELDVAINEAREFVESWCPKMSKISCILQSEPLVMKVQSSSLKICHKLEELLQSSARSSILSGVHLCMQELQYVEQERISISIEEALRIQRDGNIPSSDHLLKIAESLGLTLSHELLKESVALENKRMKAQLSKTKGELDHISQIMDLFSHIRSCVVKLDCFKMINGVSIPSYFRCPLSLELMVDPVIVASGQTYERASIQKWLDHELIICPQTRLRLAHTNIIPNYTVKALIANWCEENNVRLSRTPECTNIISVPPLNNESRQDFIHTDSFHCSLHSNCTSRSSVEVGNELEKQKVDTSSRLNEELSKACKRRDNERSESPSPEQSYIHSRSESVASAISSVDYMPTGSTEASGISDKNENVSEYSGEITSERPTSSPTKDLGFSPWPSGNQSPKVRTEMPSNGSHSHSRTLSHPFSDSGSDDLTTASHVEKMVEDLKSQSIEVQTRAAAELRFLAKHNMENRLIIGRCGAISLLLALLYSEVQQTQEHAVTALLNLSINEDNKAMIAEAGAIAPLIHVLKSGNAGAKENSAAALFSLSVLEEYKAKIGRSGAVKALVDLLGSGTLRGKKDAATALFNLSIFHENKARIVQAGAVKHLVELMDPTTGMVDKAVALLANLSTISEGRVAIVREGGIPLLVEVVETGTQRGKENAASVLLQLCINSAKYCTLVLQEGAVPPLVALSQSGTPRAKEKAQQLLSHFRSQREGANGKKK
ncbi:U-box domain-containing protein 3 isoform X2 [Malania oleifera]|uniref:U-box domain-containing protein 3 isoform X2 n=2 Tax=Malania oleifera TaxID=397392 RepID=UPI0025AE7C85|nr:U-box domain-containing protein 3 isoform X2 [Malania oleifera]